MAAYANGLFISRSGKGIPYGAGPRDNGDFNHGFKNLKGNLDLISEIPELKSDPALLNLVYNINHEETGLLSIGCLSSPVVDEGRGYRVTGYIEFAFNSVAGIEDAANYFPIFFHFDQDLHVSNFPHRVQFSWEIEGAHFAEANAGGFTMAITINTDFYPSQAEANEAWDAALGRLSDYLASVPYIDNSARLYPREEAKAA